MNKILFFVSLVVSLSGFAGLFFLKTLLTLGISFALAVLGIIGILAFKD